MIGFFISIILHGAIVGLVYYYQKTEPVFLESEKNVPLTISLNTFIDTPKQEVTLPKQSIKPKKQKLKNITKPKPITKTKTNKKHEIKQNKKEFQDSTLDTFANIENSENIEITDAHVENIDKEDLTQIQQETQSTSLSNENSLRALIIAAINKHKGYPSRARKMNIEGVVLIEFLVSKNGEIVNPKILKSSGYKVFDAHTLKSLKKASQDFPKLTEDMFITVSVDYYFER